MTPELGDFYRNRESGDIFEVDSLARPWGRPEIVFLKAKGAGPFVATRLDLPDFERDWIQVPLMEQLTDPHMRHRYALRQARRSPYARRTS